MKTETKLVYVKFCPFSENGISHCLFDLDMREHLADHSEYQFLCEIVLPVMARPDIEALATAKFDREIAEHVVSIEAIKIKKQQLLALDHDGGDS